MNWSTFFAIGTGAALGAWLRWGLGELLNPLFLPIMLGTLAANVIGGFLMGSVLALIHVLPGLSLTLKLFLTTGFLGGLTTFSSFSGEALGFMQRAEWGWFGIHAISHFLGALVATWAGYTFLQFLRS